MKVITKEDIIKGLKETGLKRNDTVIVHTSQNTVPLWKTVTVSGKSMIHYM